MQKKENDEQSAVNYKEAVEDENDCDKVVTVDVNGGCYKNKDLTTAEMPLNHGMGVENLNLSYFSQHIFWG